MRINHRFRDGKAEAKTSKTAGDRNLALFEGVEDFIDLFRLDPNASIGDSDFNLLRRRIGRFDNDTAFSRGEFYAVLDKIPKHLLQTAWVPFFMGVSGAESNFPFSLFLVKSLPPNFHSP